MNKEALEIIANHSKNSTEFRESFLNSNNSAIVEAAKISAIALARGHKILLCANGKSTGLTQIFTSELMGGSSINRPPLAAVNLSSDSSVLLAIASDYDFDEVYAKQVQALGQKGDILFAISSSGNCKNIAKAIEIAKENEMICIALTGDSEKQLFGLCDILFTVQSRNNSLINEIHLTLGHLWCELIDHFLFTNVMAIKEEI